MHNQMSLLLSTILTETLYKKKNYIPIVYIYIYIQKRI